MKKILFTVLLTLSILISSAPLSLAAGVTFQEMIHGLQENVAEESENVQEGAEGLTLSPFVNDADEGASVIILGIQRFLDFFKLIVTPIAVLFTVIMGLKMVAAGNENEEVAGKAKNYIKYAIEGLIVIFMADSIVNVIFGAEGEIFRGGEVGAQEFATRSSNFFKGIYTLVQTIIGSVAVFILVMAGMRYVAGSTSDDQLGKAKNQIKWSMLGLFIIGISEFVIKDVLFDNQGQNLGMEAAKQLFADLTNFVAGTLGTLSFVMLIYAGFLYLTAAQNEDNVAKAKKVIFGALIGIVIAISAFAITNTFVELDASR